MSLILVHLCVTNVSIKIWNTATIPARSLVCDPSPLLPLGQLLLDFYHYRSVHLCWNFIPPLLCLASFTQYVFEILLLLFFFGGSVLCSFLLLNSNPSCGYITICLSIFLSMDCLIVGATGNKAALNTPAPVLCGHVFILLG